MNEPSKNARDHVHVWTVPDLAFFHGQSKNTFPGKCACGKTTIQSGAEWQLLERAARSGRIREQQDARKEQEGADGNR